MGLPRTPPAALICWTASNVAARCVFSIAAVTPVSENKTPTRQVLVLISVDPKNKKLPPVAGRELPRSSDEAKLAMLEA
jgi:hypothetical protein